MSSPRARCAPAPVPSGKAGVAIMSFTLSMHKSICRSRLAKAPDISSLPYTMNDATTATRHTPASIVPASQQPTATRHMSTLEVFTTSVCRMLNTRKRSSIVTFARSHSAMESSSFLRASPTKENARTTPMPWMYSSTAPTMAPWAATRRLDTSRAFFCIQAFTSRNTAMVTITTAPRRQSNASRKSAMIPENTNPEMTFVYTWPPAFCTSSSVFVMVPAICPRLFSLK